MATAVLLPLLPTNKEAHKDEPVMNPIRAHQGVTILVATEVKEEEQTCVLQDEGILEQQNDPALISFTRRKKNPASERYLPRPPHRLPPNITQQMEEEPELIFDVRNVIKCRQTQHLL